MENCDTELRRIRKGTPFQTLDAVVADADGGERGFEPDERGGVRYNGEKYHGVETSLETSSLPAPHHPASQSEATRSQH